MSLHSLTVSAIPHVDNNVDNEFNANDWQVETKEPQPLEDLTFPLPKSKLLVEQ